MDTTVDHLAMAKEDLAIAESTDAKREAYKRAAEHIAAHKQATGDGDTTVATVIGCKREKVRMLSKWREAGFPTDTPWLMDRQATTRAAISHAKKVVAEQPKKVAEMIAGASPEVRGTIIAGLARDERTADEMTIASVRATDERTEQRKKGPRAVRKAKGDRTHLDYLAVVFNAIRIEQLRAVQMARDVDWGEEDAAVVEGMIETAIGGFDTLRLAISPTSDIDWDAALAELGEGS